MDDLKIIKKNYGEKMMHLCRTLFPTLLETPGVLSEVMLSNFAPSKFLYDDIIKENKITDFKDYIYSFVDVENENKIITDKTPQELLSEAGYDLYECKTEEDVQSFKKYYAKNEELCTFYSGRLNSCYVFFAVKKNANDIKRENFPNPQRQDEYGTSVISIQFSRGKNNTLSIKNRYNHSVNNPDSTFNNNLDNIIEGLNESFSKTYNLNFNTSKTKFELSNYVRAKDGKYYKYNHEINNIYYCPGNIIIDNFTVIDKYSKELERYIIMDYFIIDLKEKIVALYDKNIGDSFIENFENIEKINVTKDKETNNKTIEIIYGNGKYATFIINNKHQLIEYHNNFIEKINDNYLLDTPSLITFEALNLKEIADYCLNDTHNLTTFEVPNLEKIGDCCLGFSPNLITLKFPNLVKIGCNSLTIISKLKQLEVPNLIEIDTGSMIYAEELTTFEAPNLIEIGINVLNDTSNLKTFKTPKLLQMGHKCLEKAPKLITFETPELLEMGIDCLRNVNNLSILEFPKLKKMQYESLENAPKLTLIKVPMLEYMGDSCMKNVKSLTNFDAPNLIEMGSDCLYNAKNLITFNAPNLTKTGFECLEMATNLTNVNVPSLEESTLYGRLYRHKFNLPSRLDKFYYESITQIEESDPIRDSLNNIIIEDDYEISEFEQEEEIKKEEGIHR